MKVSAGDITSSPGSTPASLKQACSAAVPLTTAMARLAPVTSCEHRFEAVDELADRRDEGALDAFLEIGDFVAGEHRLVQRQHAVGVPAARWTAATIVRTSNAIRPRYRNAHAALIRCRRQPCSARDWPGPRTIAPSFRGRGACRPIRRIRATSRVAGGPSSCRPKAAPPRCWRAQPRLVGFDFEFGLHHLGDHARCVADRDLEAAAEVDRLPTPFAGAVRPAIRPRAVSVTNEKSRVGLSRAEADLRACRTRSG